MKKLIPILLILSLVLVGCGLSEADVEMRVEQTVEAYSVSWTQAAQAEAGVYPSPTLELVPTLQTATTPTSTPEPYVYSTLSPEEWREWPVIPTHISPKMVAVYELGQLKGNDPHARFFGKTKAILHYLF